MALCISWLIISQDLVIGIGQQMSKFWDRVMAKFLETNVGVDPPRTLCSVQIDGIKSDIIVQNGVGYSHRSQICRKVKRTSPTRSVIYCYNFV